MLYNVNIEYFLDLCHSAGLSSGIKFKFGLNFSLGFLNELILPLKKE